MKKNQMLLMGVFVIAMIVSVASCNSPEQKMENAKKDVVDANEALDKANAEYLADIDKTRRETHLKIVANEKNIQQFNKRIEKEKAEAKADYKKRIAELDAKNYDLKLRMENYKAQGQDDWATFKHDFNKEMNDLLIALDELNTL
jgi:hypothetical protein